jgi:hypothetical protein
MDVAERRQALLYSDLGGIIFRTLPKIIELAVGFSKMRFIKFRKILYSVCEEFLAGMFNLVLANVFMCLLR